MKIKIVSAAIALGAAALVAAPVASATPAVYLEVLHDQGIYSDAGDYGPNGLLDVGYMVCDELRAGVGDLEMASVVYQYSGLSAYDSGFVVGAAQAGLCPDTISGKTLA